MQLFRKTCIFADNNDHAYDQNIGGESESHPERRDKIEKVVWYRVRGRNIPGK